MIVNNVLTHDEIKLNLMGTVSNDTPSLTRAKQGVAARFKELCNHLVAMKDIGYLLDNIFKTALDIFPKYIVDIIKNICSHFSYTQRCALLRDRYWHTI